MPTVAQQIRAAEHPTRITVKGNLWRCGVCGNVRVHKSHRDALSFAKFHQQQAGHGELFDADANA